MLIQTNWSEKLDHEFNLLIYFKISSICNWLFVEIGNKNFETDEVKSVYWEEHELAS